MPSSLWRSVGSFALLVALGSGCGASQSGALDAQPRAAREYASEARSGGIRGGEAADEVASLLQDLLEARGDDPDADGALSAAAAMVLRAAATGETTGEDAAELATRRFGFVGTLWCFATIRLDENARSDLAQLISSVPGNVPMNRYGIAADARVGGAAVLIGSMEVTLDDFPRQLAKPGLLELKGEVAERFQRASVYVTSSRGTVREFPMRGRSIDLVVRLGELGTHQLEILGYGERGPEVLVNVPIGVGVEEAPPGAAPAVAEDTSEPVSPERAEQEVLELMNAARAQAGARRLMPDPQLRAVALAHSQDMADNGFHAHVSPTTGSPADRMRRAGVRATMTGENIARAGTPAAVHRGLMSSPAHRSALLEPSFTHVGIGVVSFRSPIGAVQLIATQVFARRPDPEAARQTATSVVSAIHQHRAARRIPAVQVDPALASAAASGMRAFDPADPSTHQRAARAAFSALQAEVNRTGRNRLSVCATSVEILETAQLAELPLIVDPELKKIGVGAHVVEAAGGPRLVLLLLAEGSGRAPIRCQ